MSTPTAIIKANWEARQAKMAELRSIDEAAEGRAYDDDENAKVAELRADLEAIDQRVQSNIEAQIRSIEITDATTALLGAIEDRESGTLVDQRSIGARFEASEDVRNWDGHGKVGLFDEKIDLRAVTTVTTGATSGGSFIVPDRLGRIGQDFLDRKVFLTDLLSSIPVSNGSVEYVQDESPLADLSDKAIEVAENTAKPQAGPTFDVVVEPVQTIAAWMNITRQALADVPQLRGYLDTRLRYSLKRRYDKQVINGSGAGNIIGLLQRSGIVTYTPAAPEPVYQSLRHGIRLGEDNEAVYEIVVLNPADAEAFDLSNHAADGLHAVPNVAGPSARTSWGLTQVRSTAIAAGTAMLIDPMAVALLDRQSVAAYLTDSHASNFISNVLTLLLEMRAGVALFDPKGVAAITFDES